jgi:hypothetical protein
MIDQSSDGPSSRFIPDLTNLQLTISRKLAFLPVLAELSKWFVLKEKKIFVFTGRTNTRDGTVQMPRAGRTDI